MPEPIKQTAKWVTAVSARMCELVKEAKDDRQEWQDIVEETLGWYQCDRTVIFKTPESSEARKQAESQSQSHIPILRQHVDSFVASTTHGDIKIRYVPKIDQQGMEDVTRMGNALFDSHRSLIFWDSKMHTVALQTAIFGRSYMGLYIDEVQVYPDPLASIRIFNPWQMHSTPGVPFEQATEVVVTMWIDREELKAQYPQFADEIDLVDGREAAKDEDESKTVGLSSPPLPEDSDLPGFGGKVSALSTNAIQVRERWKFDSSQETYSVAQSEAEAMQEQAVIGQAIEKEQIDMLPQNPKLLYSRAQYHQDHADEHAIYADGIRRGMNETRPERMMNDVGVIMEDEVPVWSIQKRAVAEQALAILDAHEQIHLDELAELEEWEVGKYPKYEGGWRHSIIIGQTTQLVGVYDGYSKFLDYGIKGVPIVEFNIQPSALNDWIGPYGSLMVDENKLLNGFINRGMDNASIFGNHQVWGEEGTIKDPAFKISTDPAVPTQVPPQTMFNLPGGKAGIIPAVGIPQWLMPMTEMVLALTQQTSGVFGSLRGQRQQGVRSGQHEQFLAQTNRAQLDAYHRMWKNSLEKLGIMLFKLMLAVPPDDQYVKPMIDGEMVQVDMAQLENLEFTIEVIMAPAGQSSTEERQSMLLGFTQNLFSNPVIAADPRGAVMLLKFMAESIKLQMPDMSAAMMKYATELEQRIPEMEQRQQQAMQEQQKPPTR